VPASRLLRALAERVQDVQRDVAGACAWWYGVAHSDAVVGVMKSQNLRHRLWRDVRVEDRV
jgi:hypothetical protein